MQKWPNNDDDDHHHQHHDQYHDHQRQNYEYICKPFTLTLDNLVGSVDIEEKKAQ